MTRVLHTGDTHLGYRQYHSPERQRDFLAAFERVIEDAIEADVDAVVHAGDLFHDRRPRLQDIMGALSVLRTLADTGIPFLAIVGNHEGKRDAQWLDLFESLGLATRLDEAPTVIGNTAFYGLDFVPRARRDDLDYDFESTDAEYAALVSHGLFQPFAHGDWDAREILADSPVDFSAMLLGDDHTPAKREVEGTWLTYCGSTERASADEREARGYNLVRFEDAVDVRRRSIDTREFVFIDVELAEEEGVERVRERVDEYDLVDAVVIVSIDGEGERVPPATIEEFARDRGALIARVNDQRDIDDEAAYEVSFADPDDAVHERIQQLGLSPAARELDEVVRASKTADSNVDDAVESRVRDLVDEADAATFEPAPSEEADTDGEAGDSGANEETAVAAEREAVDDAGVPDKSGSGDRDATDLTGESDAQDDTADEQGAGGGEDDEPPASDGNAAETTENAVPDDAEATDDTATMEDAETSEATVTDETEEPANASEGSTAEDGDGQATMEEYL